VDSTATKFEAERAELDALLSSDTFGRVGNVPKTLSFVCEKYFDGSNDDVKEYDIAVYGLGRPKDFDPRIDTIVRVTAHFLRKRLEHYYQTEGAEHAVHIYLPPGRYVPRFVHTAELKSEKLRLGLTEGADGIESETAMPRSVRSTKTQRAPLGDQTSTTAKGPAQEKPASDPADLPAERALRTRNWTIVALILLSICAIVAAVAYLRVRNRDIGSEAESEAPTNAPVFTPQNTVFAQIGDGRAPYLDHAGQTWGSDTACSGGTSFSVPARTIQGTWDPQLFLGGRRGLFHCAFAMPAGIYEVHLLFAETSGIEETARINVFAVNGGPTTRLDVVDDANGDDIETEKVFTNIHPQADGKIHLDFTSTDSYLNAVEILPGIPDRMLPVRIYAGHTPYRDSQGNVWLPNRDFFGGRASRFEVPDAASIPNGALYAAEWIGHFHYVIPVAHGEKYTVKLYFRESWFGAQNGRPGGVGSRVFDVWCNGSVILKNFDILQEAGSAPLIKTFSHIEPTGQDNIQLFFEPLVNYPSLSAIEVTPE
jgi:malectin (di-glucose binding ER protein)